MVISVAWIAGDVRHTYVSALAGIVATPTRSARAAALMKILFPMSNLLVIGIIADNRFRRRTVQKPRSTLAMNRNISERRFHLHANDKILSCARRRSAAICLERARAGSSAARAGSIVRLAGGA